MRKGSIWLKRFIAIAVALAAVGITLLVNFVGTILLEHFLRSAFGTKTLARENWPLVVDYQDVGAVFFWGYPIAIGITTLFFFWRGVPSESRRTMLYVLLLAVVGPLTFINYTQSDQWLNLWIQSCFNLFVAFVGYVVILRLRQWRPKENDLKAIQSLSILFIASLLVALPLFYTAIFLAFEVGLVGHKQIDAIPDKIPLAVAGLAGTVSVFLNNLDSFRKGKRRAAAHG